MAGQTTETYPVSINIEYPPAQHRLRSFARLPLSTPFLVFSLLLNIGATLAIWAAIFATQRIPSWLFAFQIEVGRWHTRTAAYVLLLTDHSPTFGGDHPVTYTVEKPQRVLRSKLIVWKVVTAIPHVLVLIVLTITLVPVTVLCWIAVVATGRYPLPLHRYVTGIVIWHARVVAYLQSLTDEFPPFSLSPTASRASRSTYRASTAIGLVVISPVLAFAGFIFYLIGFTGTHVVNDVSYDSLRNGDATAMETVAVVESGRMQLTSVIDPLVDGLELLHADRGSRYVSLTISIQNRRGGGLTVDIEPSSFKLEDTDGAHHRPALIAVDGSPGPGSIQSGIVGIALLVFEVPIVQQPRRLTWDVIDYITLPRRGETIDWNFD